MVQENDCCTTRGMDVFAEDVEIVTDYATNVTLPESEPGGTSVRSGVFTYAFTAGDDTLNVRLVGSGAGDTNPIINGATLELVPEPGTLTVLGAAAAPMLLLRWRRGR